MTLVGCVLSLNAVRKRLIFLALDLAMIPLAFASAFAVLFSTFAPVAAIAGNWQLVPLLVAAALGLRPALGIPDVRLKNFNRAAGLRLAVFVGLLALAGAAFSMLGGIPILPGYHVVFGLVYFALICGARIALVHAIIAICRRSGAVTRVLIYGAGRTGMTLAAALRDRPDIVPVAFVDDNATLSGLVVAGLPVFPGPRVDEIVRRLRATRVILAMPSLSLHRQTFLSRRLERLGLEVQTLPAFAQLIGREEMLDKLQPIRPRDLMGREQLSDPVADGALVYSGASVLISGAGGSIGLELCRQLVVGRPRKLVLLELNELALYNAERELRVLFADFGTEIVPVLGSVDDGVLVERTLRGHGVEIVLHAAAYKHVPIVEANPRVGFANNALGTAVIAQRARDCGVRRFVLISSDKAVRPANMMGASKRFAELVIQDLATRSKETRFSIVRFGNVLGSSGSVLPLFQDQIACGGPVTLTDENVTRYFMTIQEAARLVLLAGSFASGGEVYVLDMGAPVSIRQLARQVIEASGYSVRDAANPDGDIAIVTTGLRPGEKLHEELMIAEGREATAHPKIIAVREDCLSEIEMAAAMRDVKDALDAGDDARLRACVLYWARDHKAPPAAAQAPELAGQAIRHARRRPDAPGHDIMSDGT